MASQEHVRKLSDKVSTILGFDRPRLVKREAWGSITFEKAEQDLGRIFDIANYLKILPLEYLTNQTSDQITNSLENCRSTLEQVSKFSLESSGNPSGTRDQLVEQVRERADHLAMQASPWIPFLAYQKGDVNQNIDRLNKAVSDAADLMVSAKKDVESRSTEIDSIIAKAREASAAAGAAVFTTDFRKQADELEIKAQLWLKVTAALAVATLIAASAFYLSINPASEQLEVVQRIASKLAILGVFITATVWCGRIYKAVMHQSGVYRFKALGLQTFQAFSAGSAEPQTKDAVLLETTRSIFAQPSSGYIDDAGGSDTHVIEVLKTALPSHER